MISGCTCGNKYKIGTGFDFVAKRREYQVPLPGGTWTGWFMSGYNGELNTWAGTDTWATSSGNKAYLPTSVGGILNIQNSSSYVYEGDTPIVPCNFCSVSTVVSGNGSVSVGGTAYGKYRVSGSSVGITTNPSTGYKLKKLIVNGAEVSSSQAASYTINEDISVVAYFVPSSYSATCNTPSGGTVMATKNGVAVADFPAQPITGLQPDDVISVTCTPNTDKMVQNFVVDGMVTSGGSTGPQTFTFTVYEREDDAVYNCTVAFSNRTSVVDTVVGKSNGTADDATVTTGSTTVTRDANGSFNAFVGNTYTATAAAPTIFRSYNGWKNANGELVAETYAYSWTQGSSSVGIVADYTDKPLYIETLYVGTSTSDYGTGSSAVVAGCEASITRPTGESKVVEGVTYYLGGTRTVTATTTPTGWTFSGVYVSDSDASGGTKFYKANGSSAVTFDNACNAIIYAIFTNGESVDPSDVDQGNSSIATSVTGLNNWEGSGSNMTMTWHSRRNIASMPMTLSAARVYADAYNTSGTNDVKLKVLTFQSPDSTDSKAVETTAKSQDAYRLPMRRPEKYIEMVITAPHQVTQIAIGTSMEALWQA